MNDANDLSWILEEPLSDEDLAWDHTMEISGSVYRRMRQLGMKSKDLAEKMGVSPARVSRILKGEQSMTLSTLARLETALGMDMSQGFSRPRVRKADSLSCLIIPFPGTKRRRHSVRPESVFVKES